MSGQALMNDKWGILRVRGGGEGGGPGVFPPLCVRVAFNDDDIQDFSSSHLRA